jgi:hypothetical protein
MPLLGMNRHDPGMMKVRLDQQFRSLDMDDKQGIVEFLEAGRTGIMPEEKIRLSESGRMFVSSDDFRRVFEDQRARSPEEDMIKGLMTIIAQQAAPVRPAPGMLRPEHGDRVGGHQRGHMPGAGLCAVCGK